MDSLQLRLLLVDQRSSDTLQRVEQALEASSHLDPAQEDLGLPGQSPEKEQRLPGSQAGEGSCPPTPADGEKVGGRKGGEKANLLQPPLPSGGFGQGRAKGLSNPYPLPASPPLCAPFVVLPKVCQPGTRSFPASPWVPVGPLASSGVFCARVRPMIWALPPPISAGAGVEVRAGRCVQAERRCGGAEPGVPECPGHPPGACGAEGW